MAPAAEEGLLATALRREGRVLQIRHGEALFVEGTEPGGCFAPAWLGGEVAALFVPSTDYRAIQVKGRAESLTAPTLEQLQLIEQHVLAFAARVRELGANEADIRRVVRPDPVAVRIAVRTGYDQTPGRGAGRPL